MNFAATHFGVALKGISAGVGAECLQNRELEKGDWGEIRQWQELSEGFSLEVKILPSGALPGLRQ